MKTNRFALYQKKYEFKQGIVKKIVGPIVGITTQLFRFFLLKKVRLKLALWSNRVSYSVSALKSVNALMHNKEGVGELKSLVKQKCEMEVAAKRMLIIRWPILKEDDVTSKGILIITFTQTFSYFLKEINLEILEKYFYIVLEPSWAGYCDPDILAWSCFTKNSVFIQSTELYDRSIMNYLDNNLVPVSIGASNWVDYSTFYPGNEQKHFDSVYVANTTHIKRIPRYIQSIANIKATGCKNYHGALVCASLGGKANEIISLINSYNLREVCKVYFDLDKFRLREVLCKSKLNILLSKKEGSNRSLFESLFCDTPVLALIDNIGINKCYVNEFTGILTWDNCLEGSLLYMQKKWNKYSPRTWALKNVSPEASTQHLFQVIYNHTNDYQLLENYNKNENYFIKVNRPEIEYLNFPQFDKVDFNSRFLNCFHKSNITRAMNKRVLELTNEFYSLHH